jgi:hypothetical protein
MTKEQRAELEDLKHSISQPKRELVQIWRQIHRISPAQATKLAAIICRLEDFQIR